MDSPCFTGMADRIYKIKPGQGLVAIAAELGRPAEWSRLIAKNPTAIFNPNPSSTASGFNVIRAGDYLNVPGEWPGSQNLPPVPLQNPVVIAPNAETTGEGGGGSGMGLVALGLVLALLGMS